MADIAVGVVGKPHGLKGWVWVHSLSGETEHFRRMVEAVLRPRQRKRGGESGARASVTAKPKDRPVQIEAVEVRPKGLLLKFAGIDGIDEVERFRGLEIWVNRDHAAPLGDDEHYIQDLIGCDVSIGDAHYGTVVAVWDNGVSDMLEVRLDGTSEVRNVPFMRRFVERVDVEGRGIQLSDEDILT